MILLLALAGCDGWPDPETVYPYVYTPEEGLEDYAHVRWETETWDPAAGGEEAALYLLKALRHRPGAPVESLAHFDAMRETIPVFEPDASATLSVVGDAMWIADNHAAFAEPVAHLLDGDLRVGNLETPTSPDHPTGLGDLGLYAFNAPPALLDGLPLDLVQVNNNHSLDAGDPGLEATLVELTSRGIVSTGVDGHATVDVGDRRVAFLSYTWGLNQRDAQTSHALHIVPFGHLDEEIDLSGIAADIADADADTVVVMVHWGFEYEYYPDPHFMVLGRRLVAAGADVVVGQGPHVVQPVELCHVNDDSVVPGIGTCSVRTDDGERRQAAILYSLGNFQSIMPTDPCGVGIIASISLGDELGLGWTPVQNVDADGHQLQPLALDEESDRLDAHLGAHWRRP